MQQVDTLIHAGWVVPVEPDERVLERHSVAVHEGRIQDVLPTIAAKEKYRSDKTLDLPGHALIPGLINAHTHASMNLLRGIADDLPLMEWLQNHIWPAEAKWVGAEFVHDGTQLAIAEMLRGGTTCFNEMYFFPDEAARAATQAGIRACVGMILIDFPTVWAADTDEYISKGLDLHDKYRSNPLITTAFAPHAPYTVSDEPLRRVATLAEELDVPIHMHVHETADELDQSLTAHQAHPLSRLDKLGLLTPRLMAVHMTQLSDDEISQFAQSGAHVLHCPESNMKLASGFCPVGRLLEAGVNVALGTDGAASNNDLDMIGEMRSAALLAKVVAGGAASVPAYQALRMATINGARALGLDDTIGSLEAGKAADLAALDLSGIETQPLYNPISQIVYAATRDKVTDVWVAGRHLLKDRALTTLDEDAILKKSADWAGKIWASNQAQ